MNSSDYFGFRAHPRPSEGESQRNTPPSPGAPFEIGSATPDLNAPIRDSPGEPLPIWKHPSPKSARPPTSDPNTARPASAHIFPGSAIGFPQANTQDNAARSPEQAVPDPSPRSQPTDSMPRTRSSHSAHWSQATMNEEAVKDPVSYLNGAWTEGNTPAQSPSIYSDNIRSPTSTLRRAAGSEDGRPNSTVSQPSHLQEPIE